MQYLFLLKRVFMDQRGATGATDSGEDRSSWCSDICDILVYGAAYLWINWNTLFFEDWGSSHDWVPIRRATQKLDSSRFRVSGFGFRRLKPTFAVGFGFRDSGFGFRFRVSGFAGRNQLCRPLSGSRLAWLPENFGISPNMMLWFDISWVSRCFKYGFIPFQSDLSCEIPSIQQWPGEVLAIGWASWAMSFSLDPGMEPHEDIGLMQHMHEQDITRLSNVAANLSSIYYYIDIDLDLLFMIFVHHFAAMLSESSFAAIKRDESSIPHVSFRGKYNQQSLVNINIQHVNGFPRSTLCRSLQHWAFLSQVQMLLTLPCWCGSWDLCHLVTHWWIWWGLLQFSYWLVWFVANFVAGFGHADNQFIVGHIGYRSKAVKVSMCKMFDTNTI